MRRISLPAASFLFFTATAFSQAPIIRGGGPSLQLGHVKKISLPGSGGPQTLFSENFESGGAGWLLQDGSLPFLWHVSQTTECTTVSRMGSYNRMPTACNYKTGAPTNGIFRSPKFTLSGTPPFILEFDYLLDKDPEDSAFVAVVNPILDPQDPNYYDPIVAFSADSTTVQHQIATIPNTDNYWTGKEVVLEFRFSANSGPNFGFGWLFDNVVVKNASALMGPSCGNSALHFSSISDPTPGGVIVLEKTNPGDFQILFGGFSNTDWNGIPLPLDLSDHGFRPGCFLQVAPEFFFMTPSSTVELRVPNLPELAGQLVFFQSLDPNNLTLTPGIFGVLEH